MFQVEASRLFMLRSVRFLTEQFEFQIAMNGASCDSVNTDSYFSPGLRMNVIVGRSDQ